MSNRIGPMTQGILGKIAENTTGATGAKKTGGAGGAAQELRAPATSGDDRVELTSSAKLLERLEKDFASIPEIDRSRVDAVKTAIENGDYEVDAGRIAAAMLYTDRQLGN